MKCPKCQDENFRWDFACNEEGWVCCQCNVRPGEPPGFCPALDRSHIFTKVECILLHLHNANAIYVSNSDEGEWMASSVGRICATKGMFDQYTIIQEIFWSKSSHGEYWKKVSEGVIAGTDPRNRCHCGKLATSSRGKSHFCREHWVAAT